MVVRSKRFSVIGVIFSSRFVGDKVSNFSAINVHKRLVTETAYHEKRYEEALKRAFLGTDEDFLAGYFVPSCLLDFLPQTALDPTRAKNSSGCTAIAVLVIGDDKIYVVCDSSFILCNNAKHLTASIYQANAGDSRSVLSVKGAVKPLSFDHKPSNKSLSHSMVVMNEF
jgi:protein phosphatase 2C family protein 2/3